MNKKATTQAKAPSKASAKEATSSTTKATEAVKPDTFGKSTLAPATLARVVVSLQGNQRRAMAHTKTRGEVSGSTRKPWRQKGTGRARVGSRRTPLWRGGGIIFGPSNSRNFTRKINQKLKSAALKDLLIQKAQAGEVSNVPNWPQAIPEKTKAVLGWLGASVDLKSNLVVLSTANPEISKALKNISYITTTTVGKLSPLDVATHRRVIFLPEALSAVTKKIAKQ